MRVRLPLAIGSPFLVALSARRGRRRHFLGRLVLHDLHAPGSRSPRHRSRLLNRHWSSFSRRLVLGTRRSASLRGRHLGLWSALRSTLGNALLWSALRSTLGNALRRSLLDVSNLDRHFDYLRDFLLNSRRLFGIFGVLIENKLKRERSSAQIHSATKPVGETKVHCATTAAASKVVVNACGRTRFHLRAHPTE